MIRHILTFLLLAATLALCVCPAAHAATYYFDEEFDTLDTSRWATYARGGQLTVTNGRLDMATGPSYEFPFMALNSNPFPTTGTFTLTMGVQYTGIGGSGAGIATDVGIPAFHDVTTHASIDSPFQWWADSAGFSYDGVPPYLYLSGPADTTYHTIQFRYQTDDTVSLFLDGTQRASYKTHRPSALWIGNPSQYSASNNTDWSRFQVDYIHVEAVPEPGALVLLAAGGVTGVLFVSRRRSR